jgi:DNA-binding NarL/FixJ family response regulator
MPSRVEQPARREAARREAVVVLRVAEAIARYSAEQIGNGLSPRAARQAAVDAAGELELVAGKLRRLTGPPSPAERRALDAATRRALAVRLRAAGLTQRQAAGRLGVSRRTLRGYLAGLADRPARGHRNIRSRVVCGGWGG